MWPPPESMVGSVGAKAAPSTLVAPPTTRAARTNPQPNGTWQILASRRPRLPISGNGEFDTGATSENDLFFSVNFIILARIWCSVRKDRQTTARVNPTCKTTAPRNGRSSFRNRYLYRRVRSRSGEAPGVAGHPGRRYHRPPVPGGFLRAVQPKMRESATKQEKK